MQKLNEARLVAPLQDAIRTGVPFLGICLGMQFLFDTSDELGDHIGLGILRGRVTRFPQIAGLKVPHVGWNTLTPKRDSALLDGLHDDAYAYFVHSYYCLPDDPDDLLLTTDYGGMFCSAVARDNIYGVQFHPEKSQTTGLRILANFLALEVVR